MKAEDLEKLTRAWNLVKELRVLLSDIELMGIFPIRGINIYYMINELEEMDADLETMVKILPEINKMPFRLYCNRMKKYVDDIPEDVLKICPTRPCDTCSQKERIDEEKFNSEIRMSNKNFE